MIRPADPLGVLAQAGLPVSSAAPLARHTAFRIGGSADYWAVAPDQESLSRLANVAVEADLPFMVLGGGSNILVSDAGIAGLVILNQARAFGTDPADSSLVLAESGVLLAGFARWTVRQGLSGLEWAVSIPGTVGGAVIGNSGAHGAAVAGNLVWADVVYPGFGRSRLAAADLSYAYRSSVLKRQAAAGSGPIVLAAAFRLAPDEPGMIAARADEFLARRRATQPVEPSAGSIFRNPTGDHAGRLVESVGLKGHRVGGAQVSPRHANFIVNTGAATAADVIALIDLMRQRVWGQHGVELVPEILFVGRWGTYPPYAPLGEAEARSEHLNGN